MSRKKQTGSTQDEIRPFLKWAGNKFRIIEKVKHRLPRGKRLVEPFTGSGAVFLNTEFDEYLLCDANRDLIDLYTILRDEGKAFIEHARGYFDGQYNNEASYYELREEFNAARKKEKRAALFLYLNRHGYNGLCRYNAKGRFNVPFGRYKRPYFPEKELNHFHQKAQRAEFKFSDFEHTLNLTRAGDVVYCDPPYVPLSASSSFTSYSAGGFSLAQQQQLAQLAQQTASRGIPVLISNHDTELTRRLYREAGGKCGRAFNVQRYISCQGARRSKARELLALFEGDSGLQ